MGQPLRGATPVLQDRYVRAGLILWAFLSFVFCVILGGVVWYLREPHRQGREAENRYDEVNTGKLQRAVVDFVSAYGRLPFPPNARESADRFLSEVESMQTIRALCGGEPLLNPRQERFLDSPLPEPDGRMADQWNHQYMFLFDFDGDNRISFGAHTVQTRSIVFSFGSNGRPDRDDPGDDVVSAGP